MHIFKHHFNTEVLNVFNGMLLKGVHCIRIVDKELGTRILCLWSFVKVVAEQTFCAIFAM
jgi:hypothetical protein